MLILTSGARIDVSISWKNMYQNDFDAIHWVQDNAYCSFTSFPHVCVSTRIHLKSLVADGELA